MGSSPGQITAAEQSRGHIEVRKFLLVKEASAKDRQSVEGGCGSVKDYMLKSSSSIQQFARGNVKTWGR